MRLVMIIFYLSLILGGITFAALNSMAVQVNFYFTAFTIPVSVLIIVTLAVGLIIGFMLFLGKYWRLKVEHHKMKTQLKLTEKEIKNLRAIPLQDQH